MNKRYIGRMMAMFLFAFLLFTTIVSAISSYDLHLRNVSRNLDFSNVIFFGFVSLICLLFNLTKVLPSRFYSKPLHTFLRIADLICVGILALYISSGIPHFFLRFQKNQLNLKIFISY